MNIQGKENLLGNPWRIAYVHNFLNFFPSFPQLLKHFCYALWTSCSVINKVPFILNLFSECFLYFLALHETWLLRTQLFLPPSQVVAVFFPMFLLSLDLKMEWIPFLAICSYFPRAFFLIPYQHHIYFHFWMSGCQTSIQHSSWLQLSANPVSFFLFSSRF